MKNYIPYHILEKMQAGGRGGNPMQAALMHSGQMMMQALSQRTDMGEELYAEFQRQRMQQEQIWQQERAMKLQQQMAEQEMQMNQKRMELDMMRMDLELARMEKDDQWREKEWTMRLKEFETRNTQWEQSFQLQKLQNERDIKRLEIDEQTLDLKKDTLEYERMLQNRELINQSVISTAPAEDMGKTEVQGKEVTVTPWRAKTRKAYEDYQKQRDELVDEMKMKLSAHMTSNPKDQQGFQIIQQEYKKKFNLLKENSRYEDIIAKAIQETHDHHTYNDPDNFGRFNERAYLRALTGDEDVNGLLYPNHNVMAVDRVKELIKEGLIPEAYNQVRVGENFIGLYKSYPAAQQVIDQYKQLALNDVEQYRLRWNDRKDMGVIPEDSEFYDDFEAWHQFQVDEEFKGIAPAGELENVQFLKPEEDDGTSAINSGVKSMPGQTYNVHPGPIKKDIKKSIYDEGEAPVGSNAVGRTFGFGKKPISKGSEEWIKKNFGEGGVETVNGKTVPTDAVEEEIDALIDNVPNNFQSGWVIAQPEYWSHWVNNSGKIQYDKIEGDPRFNTQKVLVTTYNQDSEPISTKFMDLNQVANTYQMYGLEISNAYTMSSANMFDEYVRGVRQGVTKAKEQIDNTDLDLKAYSVGSVRVTLRPDQKVSKQADVMQIDLVLPANMEDLTRNGGLASPLMSHIVYSQGAKLGNTKLPAEIVGAKARELGLTGDDSAKEWLSYLMAPAGQWMVQTEADQNSFELFMDDIANRFDYVQNNVITASTGDGTPYNSLVSTTYKFKGTAQEGPMEVIAENTEFAPHAIAVGAEINNMIDPQDVLQLRQTTYEGDPVIAVNVNGVDIGRVMLNELANGMVNLEQLERVKQDIAQPYTNITVSDEDGRYIAADPAASLQLNLVNQKPVENWQALANTSRIKEPRIHSTMIDDMNNLDGYFGNAGLKYYIPDMASQEPLPGYSDGMYYIIRHIGGTEEDFDDFFNNLTKGQFKAGAEGVKIPNTELNVRRSVRGNYIIYHDIYNWQSQTAIEREQDLLNEIDDQD